MIKPASYHDKSLKNAGKVILVRTGKYSERTSGILFIGTKSN